jgi:arsenate reductase
MVSMVVSAAMNVLVLCTGNSARSILGEVLINELGDGRFRAFSAGSQPAGKVNPGAIAKLTREGHSIEGLESKSWDRFSGPDATSMDIVITVCDSAAAESCPVWTGSPVTVHWGIPDPAGREDLDAAFDEAYDRLRGRIERMLEVPLESMAPREQKEALSRIHDSAGS